MLVDYIDQHRERFGVEPICTVLRDAGMQIAPSTYYAAKKRPLSARAVPDAKLVVETSQLRTRPTLVSTVPARSTLSSTVRASRLPGAPSSR